MNLVVDFLAVLLELLIGPFSTSKKDKSMEQKINEKVKQNINLLSELEWFAELLKNPKYNKLISKISRLRSLLRNQPFVNSLIQGEKKGVELFISTFKKEEKSLFKWL
jgi:hypothetical protein